MRITCTHAHIYMYIYSVYARAPSTDMLYMSSHVLYNVYCGGWC